MNTRAIVMILILVIVIIWIDYRKRHRQDTEQAFFDSARLQKEIAALYHASQELETLDSMIIDLRLCRPDELHRAFRIEWQGSTKSHSFDFMSTGANSNTAHMIELAEDQREQLNADIQCRIIDLYTRAQEMEFYTACSYQNGEQNEIAGEHTDATG